ERLVYQARLHARFGRAWRRKAPVESLMPLRLARYGVPLAETAPAGLAAAGIEPAPIQPAVEQTTDPAHEKPAKQESETGQLSGTEPQRRKTTPSSAHIHSDKPTSGDAASARGSSDTDQNSTASIESHPATAQFDLSLPEQHSIASTPNRPAHEFRELLLQNLKRQAKAASVKAETDQARATGTGTGTGTATGTGTGTGTGTEPAQAKYFHSTQLTHTRDHNPCLNAADITEYMYQRDVMSGVHGQPIAAQLQQSIAQFELPQHDSAKPAAAEKKGHPYPSTHESAAPEAEHRTATASQQAVRKRRHQGASVRTGGEIQPGPTTDAPVILTVVDRYYLAWMDYRAEHGTEPSADELSWYLGEKGMHGRAGKPVNPSTLRRYPLWFRIYNVWAEHRKRTTEGPELDVVAHNCTARGITGQYNKPITAAYIAKEVADFERRWRVLTHHDADIQP
ncbi:hypothetical protein ACFZA6_26490, partial [Streptomyces sp. NPDC008240]